MLESIILFLRTIHWESDFHWYLDHLDITPVFFDIKHGYSFTNSEWLSIIVQGMNLAVLYGLVRLLMRAHKHAAFHGWLGLRRSKLTSRAPRESQTRFEPKLSRSEDLQKVYSLHCMGMYEQALNRYKQAISSSPHDLNTYLVGIQIVSEMANPNFPFVQYLSDEISSLRLRYPVIWKEVDRYAQEKAPSLDKWAQAS